MTARTAAGALALLSIGVACAAPVLADPAGEEKAGTAAGQPPDDLWARLPKHIHAAGDLRAAHAHAAQHGAADIPHLSLYGSFGYTDFGGPYPLPAETAAELKLTVHDDARGQVSLSFQRDREEGHVDRVATLSGRIPLSAMLSLSGSAAFSFDRAVNADYQLDLAPSYTLFFIPEGQLFGAMSVSVEASRYRTADAVTIDPMLSFGSLAQGITFSAGYTFGWLHDERPATIDSLGQATITTGPSLSLDWTVDPQLTLSASLMPLNETTTLFSTTNETTARVSASYKLHDGPRLGLAVQYMNTRSDIIGLLNDSYEVETSVTFDF